MKTILASLGLAFASVGAFAANNATASTLLTDAQATYDQALPLGLAIMGTFMCVAIGRKVWTRFAK